MNPLEDKIAEILLKDVLGMTMTMVDNCWMNMTKDEFFDFLFGYTDDSHKYETEITERCDACSGISEATAAIKALVLDEVEAFAERLKTYIGDQNTPHAIVDQEVNATNAAYRNIIDHEITSMKGNL